MPPTRPTSMLCPRCRRLINVDEPRCPFCGAVRPAGLRHLHRLTGLLDDPQQLLRAIVAVNIAMYALSLLIGIRGMRLGVNPFGFLAPSQQSLLLLGATGTVPIERFGWWWTLITANYLHGSLLHIVFNMLALRQIGTLIGLEFGCARLAVIYTVSGIAGFALSYAAGVPFTIGASAAVCGLIGAALYFGKSHGGAYGQVLFRQVGGWAVGLILIGVLVPGINNWGHIGGMGVGAAVAGVLGYGHPRAAGGTHRRLALLCLAATAAALAWAAVTALRILASR